jgi:hypothetical protein
MHYDINPQSRNHATKGRKVYIGVGDKLILNPSRSPKINHKGSVGTINGLGPRKENKVSIQ